MRLTVKLFALLGAYLPASRIGNEAEIDVPDELTPAQLLSLLNVPMGSAHLLLVNGFYIGFDQWGTHRLAQGDAVAVWPPVAGG
jgi:sulfur carrier protein ThiS